MPRPLLLPAVIVLSLAACSPPPAPASSPAPTASAPVPAEATPTSTAAPAATPAAPSQPVATPSGSAIEGAIRDGNRPPPALRVCAHPVAGGVPTCIDSPPGASDYRIEVAPGRYFLMGWVQAGELQLIAHASQIRCIRAPCPPDELIEVEVAAGEAKTGIDLSGAYVEVPRDWPGRP